MKISAYFLASLSAGTLLLASCESKKTTETSTTSTETTVATDTAGMHDHMAGMHGSGGTGMMAVMNTMMQNMNGEKMAGNTDHDFAHMMIAHHQGAVDMAALELKEGKDATLRALAQKISDDQKKEIQALEAIATRLDGAPSNYKPADANDPFTRQMKESMDTMMKGMGAGSGNVDQDFAAMMVPHHQSAIDMIKAELAHGRDTKLKEMAQKMATEQQKEIEQLKTWLAKNGGKAVGAAYICPMKCEGSASDKPGDCPSCGMALVKKA
ncbi:DUF305 domain-containing protein [Hymenobacter humi]|uniref:DUF305 domain-containing protein n=1 Tax=Hymenobacter humi TaxID=1411620 RepID=A0ABW2UBW0_9BACT